MGGHKYRYQKKDLIGEGGFGEVYKCTRVIDNKIFAIKVAKDNLTIEEKKRFVREVRLQAKLNHEFITPIIDYDTKNNLRFVMPEAAFNLGEIINDLDEKRIIEMFINISKGISYAHKKGVIHRDLKPANILIYYDENNCLIPKVSDFGLSKELNPKTTTITRSDEKFGTIGYMAPEQSNDFKNTDHRADIYSLGKILYRMLAKIEPHFDFDIKKVPPDFQYIILKACKNEPMERFDTVIKLIKEIESITDNSDINISIQNIRSQVKSMLKNMKFTPNEIEELAKLLLKHINNEELLLNDFPVFYDRILSMLIGQESEIFLHILKKYDELINTQHPFKYCDTIAGFYENVFYFSEEVEIKSIVLKRLPKLGNDHNRWPVARVYQRILEGINGRELIPILREIKEKQTSDLIWCKNYMSRQKFSPLVNQIFEEIG